MRTRTASLVVVFTLIGLCEIAGQQPPPPAAQKNDQQPPVTFKVEVNYVEIDAVVTDSSGNFVRGLTKDDFQILEQGKPQTLSICALVDLPLERADAPLFAASPIEPDVQSNRKEFNGRMFVLVLDGLHTNFDRTAQVRRAARLFVERYLGANDVAAVVDTGGGRGVSQDFTSHRRLLLQAIDAFSGRKTRSATLEKLDDYYRKRDLRSPDPPRDTSEAERVHNARSSLSTLKSVADFMAGVRGRRKAVVFFSEGIDYDTTNPIQNTYASDVRQETVDAIAAATRANVSFYGIDPRGLGGLAGEAMEIQGLPEDNSIGMNTLQEELRVSQDSLRVISDETGGFAAVNQNDFRTAFGRIIQDNSSYYVLGYYSNDEHRDGRFRPVQVRVKRPGLSVRARSGYTAPKGKAKEKPVGSGKFTPALREALDSPVPVSGLGLSVFAGVMKGAAPDASIVLALEIDGGALKFSQSNDVFADDVEIAVIAVDRGGKIKDGGHDVVNLRLRPQTHETVSRSGVRIMRRLDVSPGRYQLRVGVRESGAGAIGSVLVDLDVPDFSKSTLAMSSVLVASAYGANTVPTANPDSELKQMLPSPPVAIRDFPRNDTLALFAEIYDNQTTTAHRVAIKTSILADDGKVVFTAADERKSEELKGAKGGYGYSTIIPLKGFASGRYVLRVEAQSTLTDGGSAMREVEFRIR